MVRPDPPSVDREAWARAVHGTTPAVTESWEP
jgi:hypothetical protein